MKKIKLLTLTLCASLVLTAYAPAFAEETYTAPESNIETEASDIDLSETEESLTTETSPTETTNETESSSIIETSPETEAETTSDKTPEFLSSQSKAANPLDEANFANKQVFQFVKRMYEIVLERQPDAAGFNDWYQQLVSGGKTGADIVNGFFFSNEFKGRNYNSEEYLHRLYKALFNRNGDNEGMQTWTEILSVGASRAYVCSGFLNSTEYQGLCASYGITPGSLTLTENRDKNLVVTRFISYFYNYCLDRQGDAEGLNTWTGGLLDHSLNGVSIVEGFIFSKELESKNLSNEDFVEILYHTLLGRSSDTDGKATWVKALEKGASKYYILKGFIYSTEFKALCDTYGIERGELTTTEARDINLDLTAYIQHMYQSCFGRNGSADELNAWTNDIRNNGLIVEDVALGFFNTSAYLDKNTDDETFIKDVYVALLNRSIGTNELNSWLETLKTTSRTDVLKQVIGSSESIKICNTIDLPTIRNGWVQRNDKTYYYENGKKKTGWLSENSQRYYLNPSEDGAMQIGWTYVDGYKLYFNNDGQLVQDVDYLIGPQDSYFIKVYKWGNYLIIFAKDGDNGYTIPVKAMIASCGESTPTGDYWTPNKFRWLTMVGGSKAQWCTQIIGSYLFHSVPYRIADNSTLYTDLMYNWLGTTQSLGCIRLRAGDSKWIYDNCSLGTHVNIDPYVNEGPFDKPAFEPLPSWHTWDPTDPTAYYLCQQHGCH